MYTNILICEDSPESIFTGIYNAYENKWNHQETYLQIGEDENIQMFAAYMIVESSGEKYEKVARTIRKKFGEKTVEGIWQALFSDDRQKAQAVYQMIVFGLKGNFKGNLIDCYTNDWIAFVNKLSKNVRNEAHHFRGFLRFEEFEQKILYAKIEPKNDILIQLGNHFSDRFASENFIIHDKKRKKILLHKRQSGYVVFDETLGESYLQFDLYDLEAKDETAELFKIFFEKIAIKERRNLGLQQNLLPLRYRKYMTEFRESDR